MKKGIIILLFLSVLFILEKQDYEMNNEMIRFRVIASSNSSKDIMMKEIVVKELSSILFKNSNNIDDTRKNIYSNLEKIENKINKIFKKYNYNKTFNVNYGINSFPEKKFLGKKYKEGEYESLVIEIGEAKGNNYFCILYPSLCLIDYEKNNDEKEEYKFRIIETIKELF